MHYISYGMSSYGTEVGAIWLRAGPEFLIPYMLYICKWMKFASACHVFLMLNEHDCGIPHGLSDISSHLQNISSFTPSFP